MFGELLKNAFNEYLFIYLIVLTFVSVFQSLHSKSQSISWPPNIFPLETNTHFQPVCNSLGGGVSTLYYSTNNPGPGTH